MQILGDVTCACTKATDGFDFKQAHENSGHERVSYL